MTRLNFAGLSSLVLLLAGCPMGPPLREGDGLSTGFEFTELGDFTRGEPPAEVTFRGGEARTIGVLSLYLSGMNAWLISAGETGEILFETPTGDLELFVRDQTSSTNGVVTLFDADGNVLAMVQSINAAWTRVAVPGDADGDPPVARITFANNGGFGFASMDNFHCCADVVDAGPREPLEDPIPAQIEPSSVQVRLTTVAVGLTAPNWGVSPPGRPDRLAVTDQTGIVWMIDPASGQTSVFLDVSGRLVELGIAGPNSFDERGLLGLAFAPDYATSGLLYTYTSEPVSGPADFSTMEPGEEANHQSVILEWGVPDPTSDDSVVDPASARELLRIDEPQFNHNAGGMSFGPDGLLYISLGDGGAADDQGAGHGEAGNGQNPSNILGTLIRIDPAGDDSANGQYGIPQDNPFVGDAGRLDEIFAYGFRNPFRFSFDSATGALWLADVGQNDVEEVNMVEAGENFGWNLKEGSFYFEPNGDERGFATDVAPPGAPDDLIDPIAEYDHDEGIAVIGGFVYRGTAIAELAGRYVFGDFIGRLFHLDEQNTIRELVPADGELSGMWVLGFAQDSAGNVYVLANPTGFPFGENGVVLRIDPAE